MISEKDLCIGNWVKHLDHNLQVTEISRHMICCGPHWGFDNFDDIECVPLSPEILEKAGFDQQEYLVFKLNYFTLCLYSDGYAYFDGERKVGMGFKYLHQLQNLYYCLTGTELIINL